MILKRLVTLAVAGLHISASLAIGVALLAGCAQPATPAARTVTANSPAPTGTVDAHDATPLQPSVTPHAPGAATPNPSLPASAALTPPAAPPVTVARLERLQAPLGSPPRFAPDGRTYLQESERNVPELLYSLDGGPARTLPIVGLPADATCVFSSAWTPDGAAIIAAMCAAGGAPSPVYLVDPASGAAHRLGETCLPASLRFDARGRLVVATQTAFHAVGLATGHAVELPGIVPGVMGAETQLAFSPDGRYVAALQGQELTVVDLATGKSTATIGDIFPQWRAAFAWSSDGRQLAYPTQHDGVPELWVAGADGTGSRLLLAHQDERGQGGAFADLAWLPGTPYIVYRFETTPGDHAASEYQVTSAEGGPAKTLFTGGFGLSLSADGHLLSFMLDGSKDAKSAGADEAGNWVALLEYEGAAVPVPGATP